MNLIVYADESGTHDFSATQPGSRVALLAGYAGFADDRIKFSAEWQAALNKYEIEVFHFSEYADKRNSASDPTWPYYGWDEKCRKDYLLELATIAGNRVRFPFSPSLELVKYNNPGIKREIRDLLLSHGCSAESVDETVNGPYIPYCALFHDFFKLFLEEVSLRKPAFNDSISFVFDRKDGDISWQRAAGKMFAVFASQDSRLLAPRFGDKRQFLPLQAADMIAYRMHQIRERQVKTDKDHAFVKLDYLLWGNYTYEEFMAYRQSLLDDEAKRQGIIRQ